MKPVQRFTNGADPWGMIDGSNLGRRIRRISKEDAIKHGASEYFSNGRTPKNWGEPIGFLLNSAYAVKLMGYDVSPDLKTVNLFFHSAIRETGTRYQWLQDFIDESLGNKAMSELKKKDGILVPSATESLELGAFIVTGSANVTLPRYAHSRYRTKRQG
jgi:hypothetical protein